MKKNSLYSSLVLYLLASFNIAVAQLSQGGKPYSFNKYFQPVSSIRFEQMPAIDLITLKNEDAVNAQNKGPFRFGYNHFVNYNLTNSGQWTNLENGDRLWQLGVASNGALSLNFAFDDFYLPQGAQLFIYTPDRKHVLGAFTNTNNDVSNAFATDLIIGSSVIIEYYEPLAVANQGHFNLFRVTHGYRGVEEFTQKSFGDAGSCQINVNCTLGNDWQNDKKGVVCLVVGGNEFCTGSLVNDVPQDGIPYVLTANHCSQSNDFATWVFRFNWEASTCTNPSSSPSSQSLNTSTLRARDAGSDFCLVEITGGLSGNTVPSSYSPYFNGWSNVNTPATSAIAIHHPSGDIKKISEAANPTVSSTYSGADCWQALWTTACTEQGSSGSPLFDQNHRIVGQLYGGPSFCGAQPSSMNDYYGKFSTSWLGSGTSSTQLKVWLDPGNTGATTVDGYDPFSTPPAFARDAAIQSITSPVNGYSSCNTSISPQVSLRNYGADVLTSCTINYQVDGGTLQTYSWTGSLTTNASTLITLNTINGLSVGSHIFIAYTSNPNNNTEQNTPNDTSSASFSVITASPTVALPQTETFQSTFPSTNWTIGNPNSNTTWTKTTTVGGFGNSSSCAKMNNNTGSDITGQSDFIYTPYIDLSTTPAPIYLTFDVAYARYNAFYSDSLIVSVSNDCGTTWQPVYAEGGSSLATAPDNTSSFTPSATQWRTETISLDSYAGENALKIAFENKSGWGQSLYIDNINISTTNTTSINDDGVENELTTTIYPNPNNGKFNIAFKTMALNETIHIKVVNILGKIVYTKTLSNTSNTIQNIDLSSEAKGIYFIEVSTLNSKTIKKVSITN
ncbi:MAG: T9SS type A sorting domain-containing protein [Bacteroidia bacterium]